jgi:AcrR family transcriptional regulator
MPASSRRLRAASPDSGHHRATYHHGNLRQAVLEAAVQLLEEGGLGALSIREAARLAGVTHQAPYRHFSDKAELVAAVALEGFRKLHESVGAARALAGDDASARLDAAGVAYVKFAVDHPAHFRLMFGADVGDKSQYPQLRAAADALMGTLVQTIVEAQRAGAVRAGDPLDLALTGWATVHGLCSLTIEGPLARYPYGKLDPTVVASMVIGNLRAGLGVAPPAPAAVP